MNLVRTYVIASNVFRDVIRDRVLYLLGFFAAILAIAVALLPMLAAGSENQMIADLGLATMQILGLTIAIFIGAGLINKEIEKRTVYAMIAKPISTAEFIVGKHWGLSAVLAVLVLGMTAINLGVLSTQHIVLPLNSLLLTIMFQMLELSLITAAAILFGVFTNTLLATLLTFAVYLMGHLSRDLIALSGLAQDSRVQQAIEGLYLVLPDLARFDLKNQAVYGMALLPSPLELLNNALYGLVYTIALLAIAVLIFSRRQF